MFPGAGGTRVYVCRDARRQGNNNGNPKICEKMGQKFEILRKYGTSWGQKVGSKRVNIGVTPWGN